MLTYQIREAHGTPQGKLMVLSRKRLAGLDILSKVRTIQIQMGTGTKLHVSLGASYFG